jgi:endonuclease/exonuclease/phosphatase family metal-dependent hydrolase
MESYGLPPGLPIDTAHVTSTAVTDEQVHAAHIAVQNIDRADVAASHGPPRGGWGNRGILSATAELPNGSELDLFCNHLTKIPRSFAWPYTGQYGNGETGQEAWEEEQFLQTQKLIAFVENVSADRPAIILGDMNSGYPYPPDPSFEETVRAINLLESSFTPAYTDDYVPVCTYCDTNPLNDIEPDGSRWIDHILLQNIPVEAVKATHVRRR